MAKITWLGSPGGPDEATWRNFTFKKGQPTECSDEYVISKALHNPFFSVEESGDEAPAPKPVVRSAPVLAHPKSHKPVTRKRG